jgi:hypothetical protein
VSSVLRAPPISRYVGLGAAASVAMTADWSLAEFCWSTWLAGLLFTWLCVISGGVQIAVTARRWAPRVHDKVPFLASVSRPLFVALVGVTVALLTGVMFRVYSFVFGFYGLFLSFFAEMEPHDLFGRNGFINSDFWTPVQYLFASFWAMSLGTVVAYGPDIVRASPWKRMLLPVGTEIVRIHILVVTMPLLAMIAWATLGGAHESVVIVLLMAMFYLIPGRSRSRSGTRAEGAATPEHVTT